MNSWPEFLAEKNFIDAFCGWTDFDHSLMNSKNPYGKVDLH
jgi:hypothetical protein